MRVMGPMLTQTSGTVRVPTLMTLEQGSLVPGEGAPPGYTNWQGIINSTNQAIAGETNAVRSQALQSALSIAASAAAIPVAGWVVAAAASVFSLFGITIRGKTQHMDAQTATQKSQEFVSGYILPIFSNLPADGRRKFLELTVQFDKEIRTAFGPWWGGAIYRSLGTVPISLDQYISAGDNNIILGLSGSGNIYTQLLFQMMINADIEVVNDNLKVWYFDNLSRIVLRPLDRFLLDKYNRTLESYRAAGGGAVSPIPKALSLATMIGVGSLVLLGLGAMFTRRKGVKR